jgi:AraC family transcriptional regulator
LRNRGAFADLDQAYGRLFVWAAEAGLVECIIGLHGVPLADHRDVPPADLEFDCSIRLSAIADPPSPLRLARLGGGDYARLRHVGSFVALEGLVDRVLAEWLPISGYALRDAPIHYNYHDDPEVVPEALLRTDIFVPVAGEAQS